MKSSRLYNKLYSRLQPFLFVKKSRCWVSFQLTSCNQIFMRCLVFEQDQVSKKWLQNYHKENTQCCISLFLFKSHRYVKSVFFKLYVCQNFVTCLRTDYVTQESQTKLKSIEGQTTFVTKQNFLVWLLALWVKLFYIY